MIDMARAAYGGYGAVRYFQAAIDFQPPKILFFSSY
jgi:hypothetical protein